MYMNDFSPRHLMLILLIAIMVFGPGKIPELGKSLGEAMRNFRQVSADGSEKRL